MPRIKKNSNDEPTKITPEMLAHLEYLANTAERRANGARASSKQSRTNICIDCQNAVSGCNWSRSFTPVEGWTAELVGIKVSTGVWEEGYYITACPEFIRDEPRTNTAGELSQQDSDRFLDNPMRYLNESNIPVKPVLRDGVERETAVKKEKTVLREKNVAASFNQKYINSRKRKGTL